MTWQDWATAVLSGIQAAGSPTNLATLQGWTAQEKLGQHPAPPIGPWAVQWNNPLNTTQPWPGAVNVNPVGVKAYRTLTDGVGATVATLTNGHYPAIVAALQQSLPAQWWESAARSQLDTWGTGSIWVDYVPLTGDVMSTLDEVYNMLRVGHTSDGTSSILQTILDQGAKQATTVGLAQAVTDLKAAIAAIQAGTLTPAQVKLLTEAHDAIIRIETALRAA
jgi:hypothetical protein